MGQSAWWTLVATAALAAPCLACVYPLTNSPANGPAAQFSLLDASTATTDPLTPSVPSNGPKAPQGDVDLKDVGLEPPAVSTASKPTDPATSVQPVSLDLAPDNSDDESVYALPAPPAPGEGINQGGVNLDLTLTYFNHYVYRGVDHSITASNGTLNSQKSRANTLNLEINTELEFNLGKLPHPFIGLFSNVYDADPKSRFQEIRPYYGIDLALKPFYFEAGGQSYIYPRREKLDTAEIFGKITLDDSFLFHTEDPIFSPYVYGAYDYDINNGWYTEAGVTHQVPFEDLGVTFTFQADLAYILGFQEQFVYIDSGHDTGFQHYDVGVTGDYSLSRLFNLPSRYGQLGLVGYLFYTGKLATALRADNVLWGGAGISFHY